MHGTPAGLRDAPQLSALEASHPELRPWLRPLAIALAALASEPWRSLAPVLPDAAATDPPGDGAVGHGSVRVAIGELTDAGPPLLHGATLPLEPRALRALARAILDEALAPGAAEGIDPAALLEAAVAQDQAAIARLATAAGLEPERLGAAAQLLAFPALQACGRLGAPGRARAWAAGYCPVCGTLPALVEVRGLERARALRCARCGASWATEVLLCAFCGERDHERLGSLTPEGPEGQTRWVETCASCGGYLKVLATLRPLAPAAVIVEDAGSIHLDLAAVERGFQRPPGPGFPVRLRVAGAGLEVA